MTWPQAFVILGMFVLAGWGLYLLMHEVPPCECEYVEPDEALPEWECPSCGAVTRARLADWTPANLGQLAHRIHHAVERRLGDCPDTGVDALCWELAELALPLTPAEKEEA